MFKWFKGSMDCEDKARKMDSIASDQLEQLRWMSKKLTYLHYTLLAIQNDPNTPQDIKEFIDKSIREMGEI